MTDDKAQVPFWQRRFTAARLREGYTMGEVDAFVERARVAYLTGDGSVTPKDVQQVRFTPVRLREGYDMGEVDQTLDEVHALLRDRASGPVTPASLVAPTAAPHLPTGTPPAAPWTYPAQPAPRPGDGEAAELADHLDSLRAGVLGVVMAMPADVRSTVRLPEGRSPVGLLQHLEQAERRWFLTGFLGEQPGPDAAGAPSESAADVAAVTRLGADLLRTGERTRSVLTSYPLTARASTGGTFAGDPPTLRAIATQALAGHARLAGQLDVVAELAGGRPG